MGEYHIDFIWDAQAAVWVASSKDIPGLVLECGSFDALVERVKLAAVELLNLSEHKTIPLFFHSERLEQVLA